ncbi:alpha/beta fold hydrolase [Zymobacter palmae]|uniref:Predicted hydrolases or acyltransferases n=1 Tax=Zymobacter palmae TaxID=33074 RepID=A0A348HEM3_9GAMM|nr:alpha/beta fold hydrolase [Zymobacter palmae]BBG30075.1 predicted hydrolases or acyltransferases [Zymobacter palmae]
MIALLLHYVDYPATQPSEALPLVVLHGLMGNADNWRAHARQWEKQRRVVAIDLRNHGRSPHAEDMQYAHLAADVLHTLSVSGVEHFDLLGHSMGGKTAMSMAVMAPERIRRLIVADIAPVDYALDRHDDIFAAMQVVADQPPASRTAADAFMALHEDDLETRRFLGTNLIKGEDGCLHWRVNLPALRQGYPDVARAPIEGAPFNGPVLFLRGGDSSYVLPEYRAAIMARFPHARIVTLKHCAHWLHVEQFSIFVDAVDRFLSA